jgi:LacI family transcriptional regulator
VALRSVGYKPDTASMPGRVDDASASGGATVPKKPNKTARLNRVTLVTRDRVLRAAARMRAKDEDQGGSRAIRPGPIGLIVADAENPFFTQIIGSIESVGYDTKHGVILCNSDEDPERERAHLAEMLLQGVDGVNILPVGADGTSLEPYLTSMPMVLLDRRLPGVDLDLAIADNRLGSELAVRHLAELGHTRVAIIGTHHKTLNDERIGGFLSTLVALGIPVRPEYVRRGSDARQHSGYEQTLHLLHLAEPPTAILAANHLLTLGAMLAIRDSGLRAPTDVSLVGFDETPWSRLLAPSLTTVDQPAAKLGAAAANLLVDRIDRAYCGVSREIMLPPRLNVRESSGPPPRSAI